VIDVFQSILAEIFGDWKNLGCLNQMVNKAKIAPANLESSTALASFSLRGGAVIFLLTKYLSELESLKNKEHLARFRLYCLSIGRWLSAVREPRCYGR
jgi:hypothetical protein